MGGSPVEKSSQIPEMNNFNEALGRVMQVSKSDLAKILAQENDLLITGKAPVFGRGFLSLTLLRL
jgi:hypothetical protein